MTCDFERGTVCRSSTGDKGSVSVARRLTLTPFVQTFESPGIKFLRFPGLEEEYVLENPGKLEF